MLKADEFFEIIRLLIYKKFAFFETFLKKHIDKHNIFCYNNRRADKMHAAMAQLVEHILGKDEVPSSNLGSSSKIKKHPIGCFFVLEQPLTLRARLSRLRENQFAFPARRSTSSLVRRRARVSSPKANTWVAPNRVIIWIKSAMLS